jgi:hypothetical protein
MGALMASTIPSSNRFRDYANVCSEFLSSSLRHVVEAHRYDDAFLYYDELHLPFTTPEQQSKSLAFLHESLLPEYRRVWREFEGCLASQFEDVEKYWQGDSAFIAASHRLPKGSGKQSTTEIDRLKLPYEDDLLLSAVDRIATRERDKLEYLNSSVFRERWLRMRTASKRTWREPSTSFSFADIRKLAEVDIKWKQALSIVIANYLERASFKLTQQAKETAKKLASLISELNAEIEKPEAKYLLSLGGSIIGVNHHSMVGFKKLEGFLASESLTPALSYREDKHLLHRTTAQEIMFANRWALDDERKDLAFILLGLAAFEETLGVEQKTLERIWKKANANNSLIKSAAYDGHRHQKEYRDTKAPEKYQFSVPNIPNIYLQNQEPE